MSAIDVYKCGKTVSVYCIKTKESEKGRERERLDGKNFPVG